jgi:hypothetical protein
VEYLAGGSLASRIQGDPVRPGEALEWLEQAAGGAPRRLHGVEVRQFQVKG